MLIIGTGSDQAAIAHGHVMQGLVEAFKREHVRGLIHGGNKHCDSMWARAASFAGVGTIIVVPPVFSVHGSASMQIRSDLMIELAIAYSERKCWPLEIWAFAPEPPRRAVLEKTARLRTLKLRLFEVDHE